MVMTKAEYLLSVRQDLLKWLDEHKLNKNTETMQSLIRLTFAMFNEDEVKVENWADATFNLMIDFYTNATDIDIDFDDEALSESLMNLLEEIV